MHNPRLHIGLLDAQSSLSKQHQRLLTLDSRSSCHRKQAHVLPETPSTASALKIDASPEIFLPHAGSRTWMSWYETTAACRARPSSAIRRAFTSTSAALAPTASSAAPSTAWTPCSAKQYRHANHRCRTLHLLSILWRTWRQPCIQLAGFLAGMTGSLGERCDGLKAKREHSLRAHTATRVQLQGSRGHAREIDTGMKQTWTSPASSSLSS